MKHAVLIIAHNEPKHLLRLISYFERDCYIFIHLDKKENFTDNYVRALQSMDNVIKVCNNKFRLTINLNCSIL